MKHGDAIDVVYCGGPLDGFRERARLEGLFVRRSIHPGHGRAVYFEDYDWCADDICHDRQPVRLLHPSFSRFMLQRGEPL